MAKPAVQLRGYQEEALETVEKAFQQGTTRQLLVLPTGTGKTVVFASLAKRLGKRTLILAHREELLTQAQDKLKMVWPEANSGIVMAKQNDFEAQVVIASIQSAYRPKRLMTLAEQGFELLIVDEAHHAIAETYQQICKDLGFMENHPDRLLLGVTATAMRGDKRGLGEIFETVVFERTIGAMVKAGYLADLRGWRIEAKGDLRRVKKRLGDYAIDELAQAVNTPDRNRLIVKNYMEKAPGMKALAFCVNVKHAQDLSSTFQEAGVRSAAVYGEMDRDERRAILREFAKGEIRVITNCNILTEGFDQPDIQCLLMARPTKSQGLYIQMVGRGTRRHPTKEECLVLDFTDSDHDVCTVADLDGIKPKNGQSIRERQMEAEEEGKKVQERIISVKESKLDLLSRSRYAWAEANGVYRLNMGTDGQILLEPYEDKYTVRLYDERHHHQRNLSTRPLDLGYAQGVGEDYARRLGATKLIDKEARWRLSPVTPKQKDVLDRMDLEPHQWPKNRGEASDLINKRSAARSQWKREPATPKQKGYLRSLGVTISPHLTKGGANDLIRKANELRDWS